MEGETQKGIRYEGYQADSGEPQYLLFGSDPIYTTEGGEMEREDTGQGRVASQEVGEKAPVSQGSQGEKELG